MSNKYTVDGLIEEMEDGGGISKETLDEFERRIRAADELVNAKTFQEWYEAIKKYKGEK